MNKIQVLDPVTIDKIAAGEVIERPASVVKELVENAIDAGATAIVTEIEEGGISMIRIADNGCGMDASDVPNAFLRHSTSKIRTVEDLVPVSYTHLDVYKRQPTAFPWLCPSWFPPGWQWGNTGMPIRYLRGL